MERVVHASGAPAHGGALDGRPLLGRKLQGKSQRELRDLGLAVEDGNAVMTEEATT